jgi:hypothetical protein
LGATLLETIGASPVTTVQNRAVANGANEYGQFTIDNVPGLTPDHDPKGNLTHDPYAPRYNDPNVGQLYAWDGENRLIMVTTDDGTPVTLASYTSGECHVAGRDRSAGFDGP